MSGERKLEEDGCIVGRGPHGAVGQPAEVGGSETEQVHMASLGSALCSWPRTWGE